MSKAGKPGRGEKSQAIRDALKNHPHLKNRELADMLSSKGIKCTSQDIANQKARNKRMGGESTKQAFTLEDLRRVKALVAESGGLKAVVNKLADIDKLAEQGDFIETCYLLLYGELPTPAERQKFENTITRHTMVHEQMALLFRGFRRDAHPMAVMVAVVGALSAFYHDSVDINDPRQREIASHRMIAKLPTIAAMAYKYHIGQPFVYPKNDLSYAGNFLHMCFAVPCEEYKVNPVMARAMDRIFVLHADHEQNASTSTVRLAGSSGANPFACISAGIACLWGPAHGGANEAALKMLSEIGRPENIPDFISKVKDKNSNVRLMGFGHRVYKNYDPRAKIMQATAKEVFDQLGLVEDPLLQVAQELEKVALSDEYFISRKLYPNVDFYSGIILRAMGFPVSMFTVLFALARTVGWISQWKEMIEEPNQKIGRPRQLYTGPTRRDYVPMGSRG